MTGNTASPTADATPFAAPVPGRARRRAPALVPLSREHHAALKQALDLKRTEQDSASAVWAAFTAFWERDGNRHFIEEETELIPAYARVADPAHPAVIRTLLEHALIRARVAAISEQAEPIASDLNELGTWLDLHVRHEERVLFPLIEDATGIAAS